MATSEEKERSKNAQREAENARNRHRYATDPEYRARKLTGARRSKRKANLKQRYGMSLEDYAERLAQQGGVCLACRRKFERPLCVDHCHEANEVRALLCLKCNLGLGYYDHNPDFLRNAADVMDDWLKRHPELRNRKEKK
jgi:hypothetical protein